MFNLPYGLIAALFGLILLSALIGAPFAFIIFGNPAYKKSKLYPFIYASLAIGYGVLHLALLGLGIALEKGYASFAKPISLLLAITSLLFILCKSPGLGKLLAKESLNVALLCIALILACMHILGPVLAGFWDMAYATGDDAARWFMVVNYFQDHFFKYLAVTDVSLRYDLTERPMQNSSGAIMMAIFGINPAFAYSLSAASSMLMSAASFMLIFEGIFGLSDTKKRYILWFVSGLFFGLFGSFINYYFTGRTTHHFSVYPMLFSLAFFAVEEKWWKRMIWFTLSNLFLALGYSIRFPMNYIFMVGCIISFQCLVGKITTRMLLSNAIAMSVAALVTCMFAWTELKSVLAKDWQGFFMQRPGRYGLDGSVDGFDVFFKWSGILGTYETTSNLSLTLLWMAGLAIAVFIATAIYVALVYYRRYPAYTALLGINLIIGISMFAVGNYYVAWKSSLYWAIYIFLGVLQGIFLLLSMQSKKLKLTGYTILIILILFICFTARQLPMYKEMTDERVTKVDSQSYEMVNLLKGLLQTCPECKPQIFGFDFSAERHLLLREIFREFEWQPIRGSKRKLGYNFTMTS